MTMTCEPMVPRNRNLFNYGDGVIVENKNNSLGTVLYVLDAIKDFAPSYWYIVKFVNGTEDMFPEYMLRK